MLAYEFSTHLTDNKFVAIPWEYAQAISSGATVRVILLVEEPVSVFANGYNASGDEITWEAFIAKIKERPIDPATIMPASGLLGEHLANPISEPDPDFDESAWNQQWAQIEAEMDAQEEAKAEVRRQEMDKVMMLP